MPYDYDPLVEILEYFPGDWRRCLATWQVGTALGYLWHDTYQGYLLYHLIHGTHLGVVAVTEETARLVLEQLGHLPGAQIGELEQPLFLELFAVAQDIATTVDAAGHSLAYLRTIA